MRTVEDLLSLPPNLINGIKHVFGPRRPFGPSSSNGFREHPDVSELVFTTENQMWKEYLNHPRIIVGRKGSGKSSILRQTEQSNEYGIVHRISTSDLLSQCIDTLFDGPADYRRISAEQSGKVWGQMINTALMAQVLKEDTVYRFTRMERYFEVSGLTLDKKGRNIFGMLRSLSPGSGDVFATLLNTIISGILHYRGESGLEYQAALAELDEYLSERNLKTVIILDSVEQYPLDDYQFTTALTGLLRCAGAYGGQFRDLRIGIPAELYHDLEDESSNIMKDFENAIVLHWLPMELLRLIAWRYLVSLAAYDPARLERFRSLDLVDRGDVHIVLDDFLPRDLHNRRGDIESSSAYILRHTQLLPRQIIKIFNEAYSTQRPNMPSEYNSIVSAIANAVQIWEPKFCKEIYGAFRSKYPYASDLCAVCLPTLPRFFDEKLFEKVYREKGKRVIQEHSNIGAVSFRDFRQALFEIGAVGRVRDRTIVYADADFEYALNGRLYASTKDELCLHPTFSGTYETDANRTSRLFVYPHMSLYDGSEERRLRI
ncbi:P-loop ATPase, Sll1717 family [Parasedimentitalea huanghaiensis]|uniref:Uncharacterized protein n=1 Tax=Parasedimentitalea huanghaiensis TaxID=2682100 RepID=A0A6L6WNY1_9RHOB|nr:hypothetical protein [Zongyanglinia huanghaiensis]MVO18375.1 hypothetical protein [Zongyanglinia huanghaiensis]